MYVYFRNMPFILYVNNANLLNQKNVEITNEVNYNDQEAELAFARIPDGTGSFIWISPTLTEEI